MKTNALFNNQKVPLLIGILILFINTLSFNESAQAINNNWIEVNSTNSEQQWLDSISIKLISNTQIRELSKYRSKIKTNDYRRNSILFLIDIVCKDNTCKDLSKNGIPLLRMNGSPPMMMNLLIQ